MYWLWSESDSGISMRGECGILISAEKYVTSCLCLVRDRMPDLRRVHMPTHTGTFTGGCSQVKTGHRQYSRVHQRGMKTNFLKQFRFTAKLRVWRFLYTSPALYLISLPLPASLTRVVLGYSWWTYMDIITQGP